jgi:lipoprotein NlpI
MGKMRISTTLAATVVLIAVTRPVPAASLHDWDVCGSSGPKQVIAGCARIEPIRLDTRDRIVPHSRGANEQAKSELEETIVYYDTAIRNDPDDDDAYFHRGIAKVYAGSLPEALADIGQAGRLDPQYPYYALWIDIVDKRGHLGSHFPQAIAHIDMAKWPAPVIRLFLGQAAPDDVLAAADDPDSTKKSGQICEANFYIGEFHLQQGAEADAARLFGHAAAECPRAFVEGPAAAAELKALRPNR